MVRDGAVTESCCDDTSCDAVNSPSAGVAGELRFE